MGVKVKDATEFVEMVLGVLESSWGVRTLLERDGVSPIKVMIMGNQLLGRLVVMGREGKEEL